MFGKKSKRELALRRAVSVTIEHLEQRRLLTTCSLDLGTSVLTVLGDDGGVGNNIVISYNSGATTVSVTDSVAGVNAACTNRSGVVEVDAYGGTTSTATSTGNDTIDGSSIPSGIILHLHGLDGNDTLKGGDSPDELWGDDNNDSLYGGKGNDTIHGGADNDNIDGYWDNDLLWGDGGDDVITGNADTDTLHGGDGNDTLGSASGDSGDDEMYGEGDDDSIRGGGGDDHLWGDGEDDTSYDGADIIYGDDGFDQADFSSRDNDMAISLDNSANDGEVTAWAALVSLSRTSNVVTVTTAAAHGLSAGDMVIIIDVTPNAFNGAFTVATTPTSTTFTFSQAASNGSTTDVGKFARAVEKDNVHDDVERVCGGNGDDWEEGANSVANYIKGSYGNDTLRGLGGQDSLFGDDGTADWVDYGERASNDPVYIDLTTGSNHNGSSGGGEGDYFEYIENARGGAGNDTVLGDSGSNVILGGDGADSITGDAGNDTIIGGNGGDSTLSGGDGDDSIVGGSAIDNIYCGAGADVAYGDAAHDFIFGGDGNDSLHGGQGKDELNGEGDDDQLWGDDEADTLNGGAGNDTLTGGLGSDQLSGGDGDDVFHSKNDSSIDTVRGDNGTDDVTDTDANDNVIS